MCLEPCDQLAIQFRHRIFQKRPLFPVNHQNRQHNQQRAGRQILPGVKLPRISGADPQSAERPQVFKIPPLPGTENKVRIAWPNLLVKIISVLALCYSLWWLMAPALRQIWGVTE